MRKKAVVQEQIEHPVEQTLDITPGTTVVEHVESTSEISVIESYDEKDKEVEEQFQEVYNAAMDAFDDSNKQVLDIDPRYRARNQEIAVQFLNTALTAVRDKAALKQHKDKMVIADKKATKPGTVNNNLIVDRNELLRMLNQKK